MTSADKIRRITLEAQMTYTRPNPRRPEMQAKWEAEARLREAQMSQAPNRRELIAAAVRDLETAVAACRKPYLKK